MTQGPLASMSEGGITWPPHCCVPAFVYNALHQLGLVLPRPVELARALDVRVGPDDDNPFNLALADKPADRGVTRRNAIARIREYLHINYVGFGFRHIPFATVAFEAYQSVLEEAWSKNLQAGIGVDPDLLPVESRPDNRHVVTVVSSGQRSISLIDFSSSNPGIFTMDWPTIERAVFALDDGYWLIGRSPDLQLANCLPLSDSSNRSGGK